MKKNFLVIGNPVNHSLSPQIHQQFAKQYGIDLSYQTRLAESHNFTQILDHLRQQGGRGANITIPFKSLAYHYADQLSHEAQQAKAVNTLSFQTDGTCEGHNTDGLGFMKNLQQQLHWPTEQQNILILGVGGACRGILPILIEHNNKLTLINRTSAKAQALADEYSINHIPTLTTDDIISTPYDLIINATDCSLRQALPDYLPQQCDLSQTYCYDLAYDTQQTTRFCQWAQQNKAQAYADGLGMLIAQAALSFQRWHGVMPDINRFKL